ncbi:excinuclease ABC subunit C [Candidatus Wolfebacteria bacterium]|nr:MAG: excinuclease ABC subunit C [Candidatus Wolfebacteria bacterium]
MNHIIYILYSLKDKKLYVGCTENLEKRLKKHMDGNVTSTRNRRPLELIYTEQYNSKEKAFQREKLLKSLWGSRIKKKIQKQYLENK